MFNFRWRVKRELVLKLGELIQPWLDRFSAEDEEIWKKWIEYYRDSTGRGLTELFFTGANEKFKAKALIILLTPDFEFLPFEYQKSGILKNNFSKWYFLGHKQYLPLGNPELRNLAVDLICLFSMYYRRKPKIFHEDFQEGTLLSHYNHAIKKIIGNFSLDDTKGKTLLNIYDCFAVVEKDDASPARIFRNFLEDPVIPDIWKIKLNERYRPLIGQNNGAMNLSNHRRLDAEDYIRNFEIQVRNIRINDFSYSPELFLNQFQTAIELGFRNIDPRIVLKILEIVKSLSSAQGFLKVAYAVVPRMRRIWCKDDLFISKKILEFLESELPQGADSDLILKKLKDKIKVAEKYLIEQPVMRQKEEDRAKKELEQNKKKILAKMCS